jgi:hypothetical protein
MRTILRVLTAATVVVVAAAALIQGFVALGVTEIGTVPGEGAPGQEKAAYLGVVALLVAGGLLLVLTAVGGDGQLARASLIVAALFVTVSVTAFDPYYASTLRRPVDDDAGPAVGAGVVIALAAAGALIASHRTRLSTGIAGMACVLAAAVAVSTHLH